MMACIAFMTEAGLRSIQNVLQKHVFYNNCRAIFENFGSSEPEYSLHLKPECYGDDDCVVAHGDAGYWVAALEAFECSSAVDAAWKYIGSAIFSVLPSLAETVSSKRGSWVASRLGGGGQVSVKTRATFWGFLKLTLKVMEVLRVTCLQSKATHVV